MNLLYVLWKLRLSEEISDAEISILDYSVIRLDRNRHEGGIAIYVRNNIVQVVRVHASLFV